MIRLLKNIFCNTAVICLSFICISAKAEIAYQLSVDEFISDNVQLRIVESEAETVTLVISFDSNLIDNSVFKSLSAYGLEQGFDYQINRNDNRSIISYRLSSEQLDPALKYIKNFSKSVRENIEYIDILISGKINQQKVLGRTHSQWSKFAREEPVINSYDFNYSLEPELKKDKISYWHQIFALMIWCNSEAPLNATFVLSSDNFSCTKRGYSRSLSVGEIANIQSNSVQLADLMDEELELLTPLILSIREKNSIQTLNELFSFLPNLSVEQLSELYRELAVTDSSVNTTVNTEEVPAIRLTDEQTNYLNLIPTENNLITLNWLLTSDFDICKVINCPKIKSRLFFSVVISDDSWLQIQLPKEGVESNYEFIIDEVVKPLNFSKDINTSQLIITGVDNTNSISGLVNKVEFEQNSGLVAHGSVSKLFENSEELVCVIHPQIGSSVWINQLLTQYYWLYSAAKADASNLPSSWLLVETSCANQGLPENATFIPDEDTFELIKNAIHNRAKVIDSEQGIYQLLSAHYQFDIKRFLLSELELTSFEQYQFNIRPYQAEQTEK